jgi:hypothetical protein
MGFKLGKGTTPIASGGKLSKKMRFGKESGDADVSVPGTPVIRKPLEPGVLGEANMDGSIYISDQIQPGSLIEREVINHEMRHATDMRTGKLAYGDDYVKYGGITYARKTINGKDMLHVDGVWKEAGHNGFPWEVDANNGEE